MLKISIISVFPDLHKPFIETSLIARAIEEQKIKCQSFAYSDFCKPKERIDVAIAGHGPGMVIKPEVVAAAIEHVEKIDGPSYRIFFSPQGVLLTQSLIKKLASQSFDQVDVCTTKQVDDRKGYLSKHILLICSRYEGMDIRVEEHYADLLLSIGDYVLMGGETAANVFLEGFLRLLPGVVGNADSVAEESFEQGLLDYSSYALPVVWKGYQMPEVIRSGNHKALQEWRDTSALQKTILSRFDLIKTYGLEKKHRNQALSIIPSHYIVVMHSDVIIKNGDVGTTSVGSLNLHDICRSARTYGVKRVFIVTPLEDQHRIIKTFLNFWQGTSGKNYNAKRSEAISLLTLVHSFDEVKKLIAENEGQNPLILTTSAKKSDDAPAIDYQSQSVVWSLKRPVLLVFGTGQGLAQHIMEQSSFILKPVFGLTDYNHLSVRSAIAIILDRWLGF